MTPYLYSFPKIDEEKGNVGRVYTDEELIRMWAIANLDDDMKLKFVLAFECFMRRQEILHLTVDRVDLKKKLIRLRPEDVKTGSKTKKGRLVPLSPYAFQLLSDRVSKLNSQYIFPSPTGYGPVDSLQKGWVTLKKHAKITGRARFHDIRHTSLTKAKLEKGVDGIKLTLVAGLSIETLERVYLHEQIEHLREITESLSIRDVC
jgi:integrase